MTKDLKVSGRYGRIVKSEEGGYRWMPYALSFEQVKAYYDENFAKEEIPYLNSDGDINRMNLLFQQMPKQDIDLHFCQSLKYDQEIKYNEFMNQRNSKYFDVGIPRVNEKFQSLKCRGCGHPIHLNSFYIQSMVEFNNEKEADTRQLKLEIINDSCWHPRCFKCVRCDQHLADLAHCVYNNKLYCLRHYDEKLRPRCVKCQEVG